METNAATLNDAPQLSTPKSTPLDALDFKLLRACIENSHITATQLAKKLNKDRSIITRRMKNPLFLAELKAHYIPAIPSMALEIVQGSQNKAANTLLKALDAKKVISIGEGEIMHVEDTTNQIKAAEDILSPILKLQDQNPVTIVIPYLPMPPDPKDVTPLQVVVEDLK